MTAIRQGAVIRKSGFYDRSGSIATSQYLIHLRPIFEAVRSNLDFYN